MGKKLKWQLYTHRAKREEPLIETQIKGDVVVKNCWSWDRKQSHIASEKGGDRSDRDSEEGAKMIAEKLEPNLMVKTIKDN